MSDRFGILSQASLEQADGLTQVYVVPVPAATTAGATEVSAAASSIQIQTIITSIVLCNTDDTDGTLDIMVEKSDGTQTYLVKGRVFEAGAFYPMDFGISLTAATTSATDGTSTGDEINILCTGGDIDVTVFGVEMTSGGGPDV